MDENTKIEDYFPPKKLPKLINENKFSSRLGSTPGEEKMGIFRDFSAFLVTFKPIFNGIFPVKTDVFYK